MPIFKLSPDLIFPPVHLAEDGLLAVGGDLSRERLLLAYRHGIFPWYSEGEPILWWSPDPRTVMLPGDLHISRRLQRTIKQQSFKITVNQCFSDVVWACAETPRNHEPGTWITPEMHAAYVVLHEAGYAHSIEAWYEGRLAGGLYGVGIGACFCGESMFTHVTDASKVAFTHFVRAFIQAGGIMIDCQIANPHLRRLGARDISREKYLELLSRAQQRKLVPDIFREALTSQGQE